MSTNTEKMNMEQMISVIHLSDYEDNIVIKKINGAALRWKINPGLVAYEGASAGWLHIDPLEGELNGHDNALVRLKIETAAYEPGLYSAVIPIGTNFGITKISLVMLVPFKSKEGINVRRSYIGDQT